MASGFHENETRARCLSNRYGPPRSATLLLRDPRWRHHIAPVAQRRQLARQAVTARTRLEDDEQQRRLAQTAEHLRQLRPLRPDGPDEPRRRTARFGKADRGRLGVCVQPDETDDKLRRPTAPCSSRHHPASRKYPNQINALRDRAECSTGHNWCPLTNSPRSCYLSSCPTGTTEPVRKDELSGPAA